VPLPPLTEATACTVWPTVQVADDSVSCTVSGFATVTSSPHAASAIAPTPTHNVRRLTSLIPWFLFCCG
jgi:hypothetical protein